MRESLSTKIDDAERDLTAQLRTCEAAVTSHAACLDQIKKHRQPLLLSWLFCKHQLCLQASVMTTSNKTPVAAASSSSPMDDVVREVGHVCLKESEHHT